jgi:cytoskeletal protein CcmA (bactofilin family)
MFKKKDETPPQPEEELSVPAARVTSVLGSGIAWHGAIRGKGGVRVEGAFEGDITLEGMLVVGETGRVTCEHVHAETVIVAGALRGDVTAKKVEIRKSGRVWGDVITESFSTEEGAFLRGQIQMEESVDLGLGTDAEPKPEEEQESEED